MSEDELKALFDKHEDEAQRFERITAPRSRCQDIHAFLLLDELCPSSKGLDMVSAAEHDIIYLRPELKKLAKVVTEDQVIELVRCGVFVDSDTDSLSMFV